MDDVIHAVERAVKAVFVAHVADEEAHAFVALKFFRHFPLLHFVAGEDDDFFGIVFGQGHGHEGVAERAGAAGYEDGGVV